MAKGNRYAPCVAHNKRHRCPDAEISKELADKGYSVDQSVPKRRVVLPPPNKTQPAPQKHNWIYAVLIILVGALVWMAMNR